MEFATLIYEVEQEDGFVGWYWFGEARKRMCADDCLEGRKWIIQKINGDEIEGVGMIM